MDSKTRSLYKSKAHHLKPIVTIGQKGIHPSLIDELNEALEHHELVKIRLPANKTVIPELLQIILDATGAELIQKIGHTATIYRQSSRSEN